MLSVNKAFETFKFLDFEKRPNLPEDLRALAIRTETMTAPCKITRLAELLDLKILNKSPSEWRIGNKGSLSLDLNKDCFYDHEHSKGGGVLDLIQHLGRASNAQEAAQFLEDNSLIENKHSASPKSKKPLR